LERSVLFAENAEEALRSAEKIRGERDFRMRLSDNGRAYAGTFSWDAIAASHIQLYESLLR
jgi:glycosyltransferase involved in cell wall biosynthesis